MLDPEQENVSWRTGLLSAALVAAGLVGLSLGGCSVSPTAARSSSGTPNYQGTWAAKLINLEDERWSIEDLLCYGECSQQAFERGKEMLASPQYADVPFAKIQAEVREYDNRYIRGLMTPAAADYHRRFEVAHDPVSQCVPTGMLRTSIGPLPMQIEAQGDTLVFRYEFWNTLRTVYMDDRGHPKDLPPSRLGHSVGRYQGADLVVETVGVAPALYGPPAMLGLRHGSEAKVVERYRLSADGQRLDVLVTVDDPRNLQRPLVLMHSWLLEPELLLQPFECYPDTDRQPSPAVEGTSAVPSPSAAGTRISQ